MQLSQSTWQPLLNCTQDPAGECPTEIDPKGVQRVALYAGLFTHALYTQPSPLQLTLTAAQGTLGGVQGIYFGERTSGEGPLWQPSMNNTIFVLQPSGLSPNSPVPNNSFAYFAGSWGVDKLQTSALSVTCFFNNLTTEGEGVWVQASSPCIFALALIRPS